MPTEVADQRLRIDEALRHYCDPQLVAAVRAAEGNYSELTLRSFGHPNLGGARVSRPGDQLSGSSTSERHHVEYMFAWNSMMADFRDRLIREELFLIGVSVYPTRDTTFSLIPGVWAADYEIDFETETVIVGSSRYLAVRCTRVRPTFGPASPPTPPAEMAPITDDSVRALSDEEVLRLLEEHGRRVIASPDTKLIAPGKISLLPIVAGKLRHRAENGELLDTTAAETRWLAEWIASKVTLHQVPTAGTIAKVLGVEYNLLKARSNAAIQSLKG